MTLLWIVLGGAAMSGIALIGYVTFLLPPRVVERALEPLVAFAAGALLGGAFLHMLPVALAGSGDPVHVFSWTLAGFVSFFAIEQFLHWHHCHRAASECKQPLTYLILIGDALHNFVGGIGVAGAFLVDVRLGIFAWLVAAAHEVPQELGDFAVLVHGGWERRSALLSNLASGLTFLLGGLVAYAASRLVDVGPLVPFAAGNFVYIGASDLVPEVTHQTDARRAVLHLLAFAGGIGLLALLHVAFEHSAG